jgi:hypothetical protein
VGRFASKLNSALRERRFQWTSTPFRLPLESGKRGGGAKTAAGPWGTGIVDVVVRGYIWDTGAVQPTIIVSSLRPDLNDEAMKLVATWKFTPLMCNDKPAATIGDFVVHFQGR